jgi:hypothetical protein
MFTLFLHGKAVKNDQSLACENKLVINIKKTRITVISTFRKESHTKHQIPACLAKNYILTSKGRHHFSVFSKENSDISICFRLISASITSIFTLFLHGKAVKNDQSLACENKLVINIKKTRIR